jgi:hypothetical protein
VKPNANQSEVVRAINSRIVALTDAQVFWADMIKRRIISIPAPYTTGTISLATGSQFALGGGTTLFPVNDRVNTLSTTGVQDFGYQEIAPALMTNIAPDSMLFCDATGMFPEAVAVTNVTPVSFFAKFNYPHNPNFTITSSSLAGLQLNIGNNYPKFTVRSVRDASTLELDLPFGGLPLANVAYQIQLLYTPIDANLKVILSCVDQLVGRQLMLYVPVQEIDRKDPQRTAIGDPLCLVQHSPTEAGNFCVELWPAPLGARQLGVLCQTSWPPLELDTDPPPWFIDSTVFVYGACADLLRIKNVRFASETDPFFNPQLAQEYEVKYEQGLIRAVNNNQAKTQTSFSVDRLPGMYGMGAGYWQKHDGDLDDWNL